MRYNEYEYFQIVINIELQYKKENLNDNFITLYLNLRTAITRSGG